MLGLSYGIEQRVSAVIFPVDGLPVDGHMIYPANARGLLQVIQKIEANSTSKIDKPLFNSTDALPDGEPKDLNKNTDALTYWSWDYYKAMFPDYCQRAQKFRCDDLYSAHNYLGKVGIDWHPLGFAQKDPKEDSCSTKSSVSYCSITDWQTAESALLNHFGGRIFLIENLKIEDIPNRSLIDFGNPSTQFIQDIGFRSSKSSNASLCTEGS